MNVWMLWHGGPSYSLGGREDVEAFATKADAIGEFRRRQESRDPHYPCVSESSAWLFFADPNAAGSGSDLYPDLVLSFDAGGEFQIEHA